MSCVISKADGVLTIRFDRQEKKNAMTAAMYAAAANALAEAASDATIRAALFLGREDFSAGNDIADFLAAGALNTPIAELPVVRFLRVLAAFEKPVIAGVRGVAIGIGTTLLLHCDGVIAGDSARFALPFVSLGLVPEAGSSLLLPLVVGRARASWLLLSGERIAAEEALAMGLISRLAPDEEVEAGAQAMAAALAALPPNALRTAKRMLRRHDAEALAETMEAEFTAFAEAMRSEEARAAFMRFLAKG
ncbi:MAG TPA: enoyl-CoA hydratase-related protein [Candidatus Dormibacteraeota bacterium]|nr:enoyl-CoA hydratase-related protein [Candidatus Dormibacteraeota bacterium]